MKQSEANEYCRRLQIGLLRARSASREAIENMPIKVQMSKQIIDAALEDLTPWLHGKKGDAFIAGLDKVLARNVTGQEFYNFMYVIHKLNPSINAMAGALTDTNFPEPNISWFRGFENG